MFAALPPVPSQKVHVLPALNAPGHFVAKFGNVIEVKPSECEAVAALPARAEALRNAGRIAPDPAALRDACDCYLRELKPVSCLLYWWNLGDPFAEDMTDRGDLLVQDFYFPALKHARPFVEMHLREDMGFDGLIKAVVRFEDGSGAEIDLYHRAHSEAETAALVAYHEAQNMKGGKPE